MNDVTMERFGGGAVITLPPPLWVQGERDIDASSDPG